MISAIIALLASITFAVAALVTVKVVGELDARINKLEDDAGDMKAPEDSDNGVAGSNLEFCNDCGVAVKKDMAQEVQITWGLHSSMEYYCDRHIKPYDEAYMRSPSDERIYYKTTPEKAVEVTEKGKIKK